MKNIFSFKVTGTARRFLAVCISVLLLTSVSVFASAEETAVSQEPETSACISEASDFTYEIENGTAAITGYTGADSYVVIPSEIDSAAVTAIGKDAFFSNLYITGVEIPEGVTEIESGAFYGCENLKNILIPQSAEKIGRSAFTGCVSLEEITIPSGITAIEPWTFSGCTKLSSVNIPDSLTRIGYGAFEDTAFFNNEDNWENDMLYLGSHLIAARKDVETARIRKDTKSITNSVFSECKNLTSVEADSEIEIIGISTFDGCTSLEEITIPENVSKIEDSAFQGCEKLTKVEIPENVTSIGSNAFAGCTNLEAVYIPESVSEIGSNAFSGCPRLTIYGIKGSYAEIYAEENNLKFLGENIITLGDYDEDGILTVSDATYLQKKLVMIDTFDTLSKANYDFNGDGEFNIIDVTAIQILLLD